MWWTKDIDAIKLLEDIQSTIDLLTKRLSNNSILSNAVELYKKQTKIGSNLDWTPCSLGFGNLSLAIAFNQTAISLNDQILLKRAHQLLQEDVKKLNGCEPDIGLFGGVGGVLLATHCLANGKYYNGLIQDLEEFIHSKINHKCQSILSKPEPLSPLDFDIMGGISGISLALSLRSFSKISQESYTKILETLDELCDNYDRLITMPKDWPDSGLSAKYPDGYLNLGVAHGVPGILGSLSHALISGIETSKTRENILKLSNLIIDNSIQDNYGINWPAAIGRKDIFSNHIKKQSPTRSAWCYGAPGICYSLILAGKAINNTQLIEVGKSGFETIFLRPPSNLGIYSPTLCHGKSGLALIAANIAVDANSQLAEKASIRLIKEILEDADNSSVLGIRDQESPQYWVENPGLLEGATGVLITLSSLISDQRPSWQRCLLLL